MSDTSNQPQTCLSCGNTGGGAFCSNCGQTYSIKRISLESILHDVFHFFTHLEKGFGYTVKQLIVAPGTMQREYIRGIRSRYQKPFSMLFLCISINALLRYWISHLLVKYYHSSSDTEADFYHTYQVFLYMIFVPLTAVLNWLIFRKEKYNYAEMAVIQLYMFSLIFLAVIPIFLLRFIWHELDTAYIEFPLITIYSILTSLKLYTLEKKWVVVIKSLVLICVLFLLIQVLEDDIIEWLRNWKSAGH